MFVSWFAPSPLRLKGLANVLAPVVWCLFLGSPLRLQGLANVLAPVVWCLFLGSPLRWLMCLRPWFDGSAGHGTDGVDTGVLTLGPLQADTMGDYEAMATHHSPGTSTLTLGPAGGVRNAIAKLFLPCILIHIFCVWGGFKSQEHVSIQMQYNITLEMVRKLIKLCAPMGMGSG